MAPHSAYYGHATAMLVARQAAVDAAYLAHPTRFKKQAPFNASNDDRGMDQLGTEGDIPHHPTSAACAVDS
jgi:hypothetical protein